jgi:hypothetical protein
LTRQARITVKKLAVMKTPNKNNSLRPFTLVELANAYGVSHRTLQKWLEPFMKHIGERRGRFFTILQVTLIYKFLGAPGTTAIDE